MVIQLDFIKIKYRSLDEAKRNPGNDAANPDCTSFHPGYIMEIID
ncbi:MAG: hypothetical protein ACOYMG_13315 [Candidatus Methylumidiphilus sp.]